MSKDFTDDNYFADMFMRRHVNGKLPQTLRTRLQSRTAAAVAYSDAVAAAIAAEADFTDATILTDSTSLDGRMALKQALIAALAMNDVFSKENPQHRTGLSMKTREAVAATVLADARNWIALREYLAMDTLVPGWFKSRVDSMLLELAIFVYIIPPGADLTNSRALYYELRNAFGKADMAPFYVRGLTSDDIVTVNMDSYNDNFALVLPYVYAAIAGRNNVEVAAYIVVEIGCAERLSKVFGVKWGYELAMSDPDVVSLVNAPNIRGAMSRAVELLREAQGEGGYTSSRDIKQFFSYVFDREADANAIAERDAVETLFTAACVAAGMPARKLSTLWSDMRRKWLLAEIATISDSTNIPDVRHRLATSGYRLTKAERTELTAAIKARIKDRKKYGYPRDVEELEELLETVKST